jgi:hypothetical protein
MNIAWTLKTGSTLLEANKAFRTVDPPSGENGNVFSTEASKAENGIEGKNHKSPEAKASGPFFRFWGGIGIRAAPDTGYNTFTRLDRSARQETIPIPPPSHLAHLGSPTLSRPLIAPRRSIRLRGA